MSLTETPPIYRRNPGGRPPHRRDIVERKMRIDMANLCASNYEKVVAFWLRALEGTETYVDEGKTYLKFSVDDQFRAAEWIMAYGYGKPAQPLSGLIQEQRHEILEIRWKGLDPNDKSKLIEPEPD